MSNRPISIFKRSQATHIGYATVDAIQAGRNFYIHAAPSSNEDKTLTELLQPILDASHTRDRKRSPPDSACARGTRVPVLKKVNTWASNSNADEPHVLCLNGHVGSGKSAIAQEVCDTSERQGRPVVSFFFFRNAGDRSRIGRLAPTLACQIATVIPEVEPFIRAVVTDTSSISDRMHNLVYAPFKAAVEQGATPAESSVRTREQRFIPFGEAARRPTPLAALTSSPLLVVLDGLDECEDKHEVQELIDDMLVFFGENPSIPLRIFITSRVEEHIRYCLNGPMTHLENLDDHCSDNDIADFLDVLFEHARRSDPVIQAYVRQHGEWPRPGDKDRLVKHIGGSFLFASRVFNFIMESTSPDDFPATPMDRLPLTFTMDPGLDGLYAQILTRSQHLPHFLDIISTIALLIVPLPVPGIASLLGIKTYEVVRVLLDLQAIIHVPADDDRPVTLFHTSLRDFLTTESRSGRFFAHPHYHVRLYLGSLECVLRHTLNTGSLVPPSDRTPAVAHPTYDYSAAHLFLGQRFFEQSESTLAIQLCREALSACPDRPVLVRALADAIYILHTESLKDLEEVITLYRAALNLQSSTHPDRSVSLNGLGNALMDRYECVGTSAGLEEVISLYREALELRSSPHPDRSSVSSNNLANALLDRYECIGTTFDLEEAISLYRDLLELRPSPHPDRSVSLNNLGNSLLDRYRRTETMAYLEEAISLCREALQLRRHPHPDLGLHFAQKSLVAPSKTVVRPHYAEDPRSEVPPDPSTTISAFDPLGLASCLWGNGKSASSSLISTLARSSSLSSKGFWAPRRPLTPESCLGNPQWEVIPLACREVMQIIDRSVSLNDLGNVILDRYRRTGAMVDIEEAISLYREALALQPPPHPGRSVFLNNLGNSLLDRYERVGIMADLEEAISLYRAALELRPSPHSARSVSLNDIANALLERYRRTGVMADLEEANSLYREALELQQPLGPYRSLSLHNLGIALLDRYRHTRTMANLDFLDNTNIDRGSHEISGASEGGSSNPPSMNPTSDGIDHDLASGIQIGSFPSQLSGMDFHPCDKITGLLLDLTGADFALSHDDDWRLSPNTTTYDDDSCLDLLLSKTICVENGIAYLLSTEEQLSGQTHNVVDPSDRREKAQDSPVIRDIPWAPPSPVLSSSAAFDSAVAFPTNPRTPHFMDVRSSSHNSPNSGHSEYSLNERDYELTEYDPLHTGFSGMTYPNSGYMSAAPVLGRAIDDAPLSQPSFMPQYSGIEPAEGAGSAGIDQSSGGLNLNARAGKQPAKQDLLDVKGLTIPACSQVMMARVQQVSSANASTLRVANATQTQRKQEFLCISPFPGRGSRFTRSFDLKGHIRSHKAEKSIMSSEST